MGSLQTYPMQTSSKIKRFTFPKSQRLVSKKIIQELFKKGKNQFKYPFKALYLSDSQQNKLPPQILISVSKRNFGALLIVITSKEESGKFTDFTKKPPQLRKPLPFTYPGYYLRSQRKNAFLRNGRKISGYFQTIKQLKLYI